MIPVPSHPTVTTPFGRRGRHWSCNRDAAGNGIHTGVDFGSPGIAGAPVVAARSGTARHVNYGSAFGTRQLLIVAADGSADFYAHMATRTTTDGARVSIGARVGTVGASGNVTGPHLHFERHTRAAGWSCGVVTDPQRSLDEEENMPISDADAQRIARAVWAHELGSGRGAGWHLRTAWSIVRTQLGTGQGDEAPPNGDTRLARILQAVRR